MASVKVVDVVSGVQTILQDVTAVRWTLAELQRWLNDAYREIILLRPDANTETGTLTCAAGARQTISTAFPSAMRLMEVVRNMAATSDKRAIRLVDRTVLDEQRRLWYGETQTVNIQHYMFDPRLPKAFMVYPPATNLAQVEVVFASVPVAHTLTEAQLTAGGGSASTEVIKLDDCYANAITDYMLYRSYSKDAAYAGNAQRAAAHYAAMTAALGIKTQVDTTTGPGGA